MPVELSKGSNKIEVSVTNENGLSSLPRTVYAENTFSVNKPTLYYVGIGVSNYKDSSLENLAFPVKDAKDLGDFFSSPNFNSGYYKQIKKLLLTDSTLNHSSLDSIRKFIGSTNVDDVLVFFVSGHGTRNKQNEKFYFLNWDASPDNNYAGGFEYGNFETLLSKAKARQKFLILNTCYSGEWNRDYEVFSFMKTYFPDISESNGITVLSSSDGVSETVEFTDGLVGYHNGLLAHWIMETLKENPRMHINDLLKSVQKRSRGIEILLGSNVVPSIRSNNPDNNFTF